MSFTVSAWPAVIYFPSWIHYKTVHVNNSWMSLPLNWEVNWGSHPLNWVVN